MTNLEAIQAAQLIKAWIEKGDLDSFVPHGMAGYNRSREIITVASSMLGAAQMWEKSDADLNIIRIVHDPSDIMFWKPDYQGPNAKMVIIDNVCVDGLADRLGPELEKYLPWSGFGLKKIGLYVDPDQRINNQVLLFGNATSETNVHHPVMRLLRYTPDGDLTDELVSLSMHFGHFLNGALGDASKRPLWTTYVKPTPQDTAPVFFNLTILSSYLNWYRQLVFENGPSPEEAGVRTR